MAKTKDKSKLEREEVNEEVNKNMNIGEIVTKFPVSVPIMLNYGLHCIGCHVNAFETLEQGCKGHGMDDEEIIQLINDVNKAINETIEENNLSVKGKDLVLTKNAIKKIKEFQKSMNKSGQALRISIISGGCSGQNYAIDFDEKITDDDKIIEQDGIKIVISKKDLPLIKGSKVEFVDNIQGTGFRINNPNNTSDNAHNNTCDC